MCAPQQTCATQQWGCGAFTDSCNAIEACGPAPTKNTISTVCSDKSYPYFYACCTNVLGTADAGAVTDAGVTCNPNGPTPPEPGWNCIQKSNPTGISGWCCAQ
jgi:hypothetical protein